MLPITCGCRQPAFKLKKAGRPSATTGPLWAMCLSIYQIKNHKMTKHIFSLLFVAISISCDSSYKLPNGEHRAFVEEYDTETKNEREFAAHVIVKNGVVKKINNSLGESIEQFDFWETKNRKRQDAYTKGPKMYSIYLIEEDE
jgi:hypothetical protein